MDAPARALPTNRSVPPYTVIPELAYADVGQASDWLCAVFGLTERLRIGNHRAQLLFGDGAVVVTERRTPAGSGSADPAEDRHGLLVRVADVDRHHAHAQAHGARIVHPPTTYPYGERQYTAEDPGGHRWTFSESVADVDPESWGGIVPRRDGTSS